MMAYHIIEMMAGIAKVKTFEFGRKTSLMKSGTFPNDLNV
jgi:hypothetical protein